MPTQTGYDKRYRAGGFGYEKRRSHWEKWVAAHYVEAFGLEKGGRLLDLPCGDGFWSSVFDGLGFKVIGVDRSEGGVEMARSSYPGITFMQGDVEAPLELEAASFDVVFCRGLTHFHRRRLFTKRMERAMRNLMRYVAPKGQLLVSYYTKRDGGGTQHHAYHPVSDLVKVAETVGDPYKIEVVGDYVQVGVRPDGR